MKRTFIALATALAVGAGSLSPVYADVRVKTSETQAPSDDKLSGDEPDSERESPEVKTFGGNLFTGEFIYGHKLVNSYENTLSDYINETIQKISKEYRTSESVDKNSFITYMGVMLIRQMVTEKLNQNFPLWNNLKEVYIQYIERLKDELSSSS